MADTTIVQVDTDTTKIKIVLGLAGMVVIVILAFLYRIEIGIVALAVGLAYAARVGFWVKHQNKLMNYEQRRLEAETVKLEFEAIQARAQSYFVQTNSGVFQLVGIEVKRFYPAVSASKLLADIPQLPAPPEPVEGRLRRLLDVDFIHLLVVGPSGSGKTTVLCHLVDNAPGNTLIYALDPHAQFGEWPSRVNEIVGDGRDYQAINAKLLDLISVMNQRYKGIEPTSQKILIVADEWLGILDKCPDAKEFFNTIGSEARKVNMSLVISSISATVDDLDVSAAIRDNLAQLTLSRSWQRQNLGELKWSRKDTELVELPGPYRYRPALPAPRLQVEYDLIDFDSGPVAPSPDPTELKIFNLYQEGKSLRAIYTEAYGKPYTGGRQVQELREVLAKFGVKFDVSE